MTRDPQTLAKLAAAYAGAVFGIYWLPIRALEEAGFPGIWATLLFNAVPLAIVLPLVLWHWRTVAQPRLRFHVAALLAGITLSAYSLSFLYTEVVRAVLLFYLTPIWGFLLGWAVLGERVTPARWIAIALGAAGLWIIMGADAALPVPQNAGDWLALGSGMTWALASILMLTDRRGSAVGYGLGFFVYGLLAIGAVAMLGLGTGRIVAPEWAGLGAVLPWLIPVAALVIVPGGFATIYGPTVLNPGTVGLLFMTEITVATITAAIWSGEPFGPAQIAGVILVTLAGLAEPLGERLRIG